MKRSILFLFTLLLCSFMSAAPVAAAQSANMLSAKQILLKGSKAYIQSPGKTSVVIKDKTKIEGALTVTGNIGMKAGKTVDGVDVSALNGRVVSAEAAITALQQRAALPTGCTSGQVAKYNGTTWACADDTTGTTTTGTTYTAGSGIAIDGTTIRSTVVDTNTTYSVTPDSGLQLTDTTLALKDCANGEFLQQNGGSWACQQYDPTDQYDNTLVVAKTGATFSTITAAMDSITDASTYNRYVILVQPGLYTEHVEMKDNVTLRGIDKDSVFIADPATTTTSGTINTGTNTTVSDVTVYAQASGGGSSATIGIYADETSSTTLNNVDVRLIDPVDNTYGVYAKASVTIINSSIYAGDSPAISTGIYTEGYLTLRGTEVIASGASNGTGIQMTDVSESNIVANISNSSINVYGRNSGDTCVGLAQAGVSGTTTKVFASRINVTNCATLELGVSNVNGTINLDGSRIESATDAITAPSGTVRVGATMLQGTVTGAGILCAVSYDQNYAALDTTCN